MKRSAIGAGVFALALGLAACGSPNTPANSELSSTAASGATALSNPTTLSELSSTAASGATALSNPTTVSELSSTAISVATSASGTVNTVVDATLADPRFSTLVSLLQATGLEQQLAQAGPYTIFAPTNEAFAALPAGTLEALAQQPELLQSILLYHVANDELTSSEISAATSEATMQGSAIQISTDGSTVTLNGTAKVIQPDITVGNGVIHVIDQVLLPPDVSLPAAG